MPCSPVSPGSKTHPTPVMESELLDRARQISELLATRGTCHAFIGGLAANVWSIPAPTYDIDLCADLAPEAVPALVRELDDAGFVPPATSWLETIGQAKFREFRIHWPFQQGLRAADIFLAGDPFQRSALARRRSVELAEGFRADVVTPEDLVLYKLVAWRHKDRAAIERLLAVQTSLDQEYLREWADHLDVRVRLREALSDAGLDPDAA